MIRMLKKQWPAWLSTGIFILSIAGCRGPSAPVHFYTLTPAANRSPQKAVSVFPKVRSIGIGPIEIPELYNRPQIVTKTSENQVDISENHRWAGLLREEIAYVLTENLSALLQSDRIIPFPWDSLPEPDLKISLKVNRFEGALGEKAILDATWSMSRTQPREVILVRKTFLEEPVADETYLSYVAAESRLLAAFSRELASEILKYRLE
jgi:uncharacterized lipoprotein YmbA